MLTSVIQGYPDTDISVHVVWVPMLGSDNEDAANQISGMFKDPRVQQYWDPNRLSGSAYSRDVFPNYLKEMASALPKDDPLGEMLREHWDAAPQKAPLWDVAFFYNSGAQWRKRPPTPSAWIKQIAFYGEQAGGPSGRFFVNDFTKPPTDTDWFVELARGMRNLTGKNAVQTARTKTVDAEASAASVQVISLADSIKPLQDHFNAHKDQPRFVAILSPT